MIIRKLYKYEGAHRVIRCSTKRCAYTDHGHSYTVEVFLSASGLDNGQMIVDFGLLKSHIKTFIDSFDHTYAMWNQLDEDFKDFHKKHSDRWIELPCSPSAESSALLFLFVIDKIISATKFVNGEKVPQVVSVRVHETDTGYAEAFREDLSWVNYRLRDIKFSDGIKEEWYDEGWWGLLEYGAESKTIVFTNVAPPTQDTDELPPTKETLSSTTPSVYVGGEFHNCKFI